MQITLTDVIHADRGKIKKDLKQSLSPAPAVVIRETRVNKEPGLVIPVTVSRAPKELNERRVVQNTIDAILMRHGYILCNITFNE